MKNLFKILMLTIALTSCTFVTVQDIETHGTATDLIDDTKDFTSNLQAKLDLPGMV